MLPQESSEHKAIPQQISKNPPIGKVTYVKVALEISLIRELFSNPVNAASQWDFQKSQL